MMRFGVSLGVAMILLVSVAEARRGGAPAARNGSAGSLGTCMECHLGASGNGSVEIIGAPSRYEADVLYTLIVRISDRDQKGAGFEISAERADGTQAGTLNIIDGLYTQFADGNPQWVTHTAQGVQNTVDKWVDMGKSAEYRVEWKAPSTDVGVVTFYAAGNAINNDLNSTLDHVYLDQKSATSSGGGVNCDDIDKLSAKCKKGTAKATVKSALPEGTTLTLVLDGSTSQTVKTKSSGTAKGKFKNVAVGSHQICIEECPAICANVSCT